MRQQKGEILICARNGLARVRDCLRLATPEDRAEILREIAALIPDRGTTASDAGPLCGMSNGGVEKPAAAGRSGR